MLGCIVLAGGALLPTDPLYAYADGKPKSYISMAGRPMLEWVVDAIQASGEVADLCVMGVASLDGLSFGEPVHFMPDQGGIVQNAIAGLHFFKDRDVDHVLVSTADIPLISPRVVGDFIRSTPFHDCAACAALHQREDMEARYPNSGRSFFKLRDMEVTLSNVGIASTKLLETDPARWEAITNARKHPWQVARVVGIGALLKFLFRRISVADMSAIAGRAIDMPVHFTVSPNVELGMDADTPGQVELIRALLRQESSS